MLLHSLHLDPMSLKTFALTMIKWHWSFFFHYKCDFYQILSWSLFVPTFLPTFGGIYEGICTFLHILNWENVKNPLAFRRLLLRGELTWWRSELKIHLNAQGSSWEAQSLLSPLCLSCLSHKFIIGWRFHHLVTNDFSSSLRDA